MSIINEVKHWYYYWRFRFTVWKMQRTMKRFSRSLSIAMTPILQNAIMVFDSFGKAIEGVYNEPDKVE